MAKYLHYDNKLRNYTLVDLTLDEYEERHLGPKLGYHHVPVTWRDADFRISFAKNKTHAYAYYTLTLKNIYGALPLANKFKEYHCDRDIYETTIEYLTAFPVDYGLVDAYVSADGPFGIFRGRSTECDSYHPRRSGPRRGGLGGRDENGSRSHGEPIYAVRGCRVRETRDRPDR